MAGQFATSSWQDGPKSPGEAVMQTRREFIEWLSLAAAVPRGASAAIPTLGRSPTPPQHTLIVGAGLAGLVSAHFAGEHTSIFQAWMEGAIDSGERAAAEVHRAHSASAGAGRTQHGLPLSDKHGMSKMHSRPARSENYPAGPAARARFEELADTHPERVTLRADMEDFAVECFQVFAKAQYDIAEGAEPAAVERSVAAEVQRLKRVAVEAMRAAYAQALSLALASARARGAHDHVSALADEREPIFVLDLESDQMLLSLHPAVAEHADQIAAALASD
jgi:hypothetical protein